MTDRAIKKKIDGLHYIVKTWALKYQLWSDCEFVTYSQYVEDEPDLNNPCIGVLTLGEVLLKFMGEPYSTVTDELDSLMDENLFSYEFTGMALFFYCLDEESIPEFARYFEWQWVVDLVKPDYTDLYGELFTYFNKNPDKFHALTPRDFEVLTSEIFRNNGYHTLLGTGKNDKGVDIRIFSKDGIDREVTLVQVKRYHEKYAIKLEAVAALFGTVIDQKADKGLFVTSSRYLNSAKEFALRNSEMLTLADKNDIAEWSFNAAENMLNTQQSLFTDRYLLDLLEYAIGNGLQGKILIAYKNSHFRATQIVDFFIVIKDTKYVSLIMRLPQQRTSESQNYHGYVLPLLDRSILLFRNKENIFRVKKESNSSGEVTFYGQNQSYFFWDGKPALFIID